MSNKIILKKSSVGAKVPVTGDLDYGELALNYADGKLYFKNSSNVINSFSANVDLSAYATLTGTQTLTNKTLTSPTINSGTANNLTLTGTLTAGGSSGTAGQVLASTGTGLQWVTKDVSTLDSLTDVAISSPQAQQVLKFNGSQWINAANDIAVASAVFAPQALSDLGEVSDLIIGISEDLGLITDIAYFVYDMGQLRLDGIVSLNNLDQSVKSDYINYAIIFGF
jgi:hypothetical protein